MSKGRSGLFPTSNANDKMLRKTAYKAMHSLISQLDNPSEYAAAVGAYDVKTGKVIATVSGKPPRKIHPYLLKLARKIGGVGSMGLSKKNLVGACAEFKAVNKLLFAGSDFSDIRLTHAIRPRTGETIKYCENCEALFHELIK